MQAAIKGLSRPLAFSLNSQFFHTTQLLSNTNSYLVLHQQKVLAWVFLGVCRTRQQVDHFVDVAYIKTTLSPFGNPTGYMLDTECFENPTQALAFLDSLYQEAMQ